MCYDNNAFIIAMCSSCTCLCYIYYNINIFLVRLLNACINLLVLYVKSNNFAGYCSTVEHKSDLKSEHFIKSTYIQLK